MSHHRSTIRTMLSTSRAEIEAEVAAIVTSHESIVPTGANSSSSSSPLLLLLEEEDGEMVEVEGEEVEGRGLSCGMRWNGIMSAPSPRHSSSASSPLFLSITMQRQSTAH